MHEHEKDILTMRQGQDARRLKKKKNLEDKDLLDIETRSEKGKLSRNLENKDEKQSK